MGKSIKIAVVDDEKTVRKTIEKLLKRDGYEVFALGNGYEAVELIENEEIDLVITDINMPGIDGFETIRRIKAISPKQRIIIMTGVNSMDNLVEAIRMGVNDYIYKPFELEEYRHRVAQSVEIIKLEEENRRLEEEGVRNYKKAAIGDMTNSIVHDIKNSMTVIIGFSKLIKKEELPKAKIDEFVDIILRQSEQVIGQLREVLDFARGDGSYAFDLEDIYDFYLKLENENRDTSNVDKIEMKFEFDDGLKGKKIVIDRARMNQVMLNIFSNAKDAMMGKEEKVITTRFIKNDDDKLLISIKDMGIGIKRENLNTIFEPFVSFGKKHGTGLGLAIVKQIVEKSHGEISVKSKYGEWTEFNIELPLES